MLVLIDNGHGKNTSGKGSPWSLNKVMPALSFREWAWTREIAISLMYRLRRLGYEAELLVPEDYDVSLSERVHRVNVKCNRYGAKNVILVSIHNNACGNGAKWENARGWSCWTTRGTTNSDKLAEFLYDAAEKHFAGMKIRTDKSDGDRDCESDFYIIKKSNCPAVLVENFFQDNVDDVKFLLSDQGREKILACHSEGIVNYINSVK